MERLAHCRAVSLLYALHGSVSSEVSFSSYAVSSPSQTAIVNLYLAVDSMFCSRHDLRKKPHRYGTQTRAQCEAWASIFPKQLVILAPLPRLQQCKNGYTQA